MGINQSGERPKEKTMAQSTMPHPGHQKHLCFKVEKGEMKSGMADYIKLVKDARYICAGWWP